MYTRSNGKITGAFICAFVDFDICKRNFCIKPPKRKIRPRRSIGKFRYSEKFLISYSEKFLIINAARIRETSIYAGGKFDIIAPRQSRRPSKGVHSERKRYSRPYCRVWRNRKEIRGISPPLANRARFYATRRRGILRGVHFRRTRRGRNHRKRIRVD